MMPSNTSRMTVELEGVHKVIAKLDPMSLFGRDWVRALASSTHLVYQRVLSRVPRQGGALESGTTMRLDARALPLYGIVSNRAVNKGFRYGFALNYGGAVRQGTTLVYHYRSGAQKGKPTYRWFGGAWTGVKKIVTANLMSVVSAISRNWRGG